MTKYEGEKLTRWVAYYTGLDQMIILNCQLDKKFAQFTTEAADKTVE